MVQLVNGIGFNDRKYPCWTDDRRTPEYATWQDMLLRCTEKYWKKKPTYEGTTCSDNFKVSSYFYEWCHEQTGFGNTDEKGKSWHLDKDLLIVGNKLYSENTCVFLPHRINLLLVKSNASRGESPIGVVWNKRDKRFYARCNNGSGKMKNLGCFTNKEDAFQAYKVFKEGFVKQVAEQYKHQLDPRAYQALLNYTVEITD